MNSFDIVKIFSDSPVFKIVGFLIIISLAISIYVIVKKNNVKKELKDLSHNTKSFTPEEFFSLKNTKRMDGKRNISSQYGFVGVYILYNQSKNLYYVRQGKMY